MAKVSRARIAILVVTLLAASLAHAQLPPPSPAALEGADAYRAMELANAWRGQAVTSFVTSEAVHFTFADGTTVAVPLPNEVMLVSVAPYLVNTHPCQTHYMSGCQGELVGVALHVRAVLADGTVVIDEVRSTMANGFIDLWLPRGEAILLSFEVDGYGVVGVVSTREGSGTCVTTMRLLASGG